MMATKSTIALIFTLTTVVNSFGQSRSTFEQLQNWAAQLMPDKNQLRYQEIPWIHDLADAQKVAKAENRPIFLWGYGGRARPDNGLEGC